MKRNILQYYAKLNTPYLHAKGKLATDFLIQELDCLPGEHVLEVGFGTGATLAILANENPKTLFSGVELSEDMYRKAVGRLKFCGLFDKVSLKKIEDNGSLPFLTNSFEKVYVESVLAIQINESLKQSLLEIKRVLKPDGLLIVNETIWLESTSISRIAELNAFCLEEFGIIQANELYPYLKNWTELLEELDFKICFTKDIDSLSSKDIGKNFSNWRSRWFTLIGKLKAKFSTSIFRETKNYDMKMATFAKPGEQLMTGFFIGGKVIKRSSQV